MIKNIYWFLKAFLIYKLKNYTPSYGYHAMRALYAKTDGWFNDLVSSIFILFDTKYLNVTSRGVLGELSKAEVKEISQTIEKNGYFLFEQKIDNEIVDSLVTYCKNIPLEYAKIGVDGVAFSNDFQKYNKSNILSPKYQGTRQQAVDNADFLNLILDNSLLAVAQEYLKVKPKLTIVAFWWTFPFQGKGLNEAAQLYHPDMDTIKFLKFFFYLTDVTTNTGPHCLIKGTHKSKPKGVREVRRYTDEELSQYYKSEDFIEFNGLKGTILAVDTRGFHKGKPVVEDERLLFQIEYDNTFFGLDYERVALPENLSSEDSNKIKKYWTTYSRLFKK